MGIETVAEAKGPPEQKPKELGVCRGKRCILRWVIEKH